MPRDVPPGALFTQVRIIMPRDVPLEVRSTKARILIDDGAEDVISRIIIILELQQEPVQELFHNHEYQIASSDFDRITPAY